ncbi:hypothetical protein EDC01DRAFT_619140 [Geopyxis carbonaria]|nr:hypothetical protein EDC01DRAFT_619140 [Geopyxis carbonaria]
MLDQVIILTGASRGLGLAIAVYILQNYSNARLVLISRTADAMEALKASYPKQVEVLVGDLQSTNVAIKAVETAVTVFGKLNAIIINHGILQPVSRLEDAPLDKWKVAFDINFFSAVALIKESIPELRRNNGRAIFVSSGAAVTPYQGWGAYGASKAGINHLAQTLAVEEERITSISIRPGVIDTKMQEEIREQHAEHMGSAHERFRDLKKNGKLLQPQEPGTVIAELALHARRELTGLFLKYTPSCLVREGTRLTIIKLECRTIGRISNKIFSDCLNVINRKLCYVDQHESKTHVST